MNTNLPKLSLLAKTIRILSAECVEKAKSGHPGMPMGAADYASLLWANYLKFNPKDPTWPNRDRFVLSAGHGSMLLYSLIHLFGYDLPLEELKNFRQWGSKTPGHPEFPLTPGVETTTGPLGQGFGNGVGIALSGKLLAEEYGSDLFNYRVFGIVSDGDLMEGVASEAGSLAGHLGLNNLIYIYDDNEISIGGNTNVSFTETVPKRFEAYNWFVQDVNGHDFKALQTCLEKAQQEKDRPSIICAHTTIGFGSPHKAGDAEVHGAPLGEEELKLTKQNLEWPLDKQFYIPEEVKAFCEAQVKEKERDYQNWKDKFNAWANTNSEKAKRYAAQMKREIPSGLKESLISKFSSSKKEATRSLSGKVIQELASKVPYFIGGSADLEPSTKTLIKDTSEIQAKHFKGRNIRFGVREHAMGAAINGLAYSRCWFPFSATFLVFSDYMRPAIRLAAISHLQSLFVFTHESFWVGEDGPTHQPIEHVASLRLIPNLYVYRPADSLEVALSYYSALERKDGPSVLLFTRQDLPPIERKQGSNPDDILKGAYVVSGEDNTSTVIIATGSEVWVAVEAAKLLASSGINLRVVSMPCVELFLAQDKSFRETVIPSSARKISLEAGVTAGWEKIITSTGLALGIDHYGASAPAGLLAEKFGFTPSIVAEKISKWVRG